jgi:hypothetical protein
VLLIVEATVQACLLLDKADTGVLCASQFQPGAFEAAMATSAKAADAAQEAALAETLLLWGGPLLRLRPLLQVAELVAAGRLERVAHGAVLTPSPGAPVPTCRGRSDDATAW